MYKMIGLASVLIAIAVPAPVSAYTQEQQMACQDDAFRLCHNAIPDEHLAWFESLPLFVSDDKRFFVHAGIRPGVPFEQQNRDEMLWIREPFLSDPRDHGLYVVHGHTPLETGLPEHLPNRLNLDTGAYFGGPLTAAAFDAPMVEPTTFITDDGTISKGAWAKFHSTLKQPNDLLLGNVLRNNFRPLMIAFDAQIGVIALS